jgi:hypothetical protein
MSISAIRQGYTTGKCSCGMIHIGTDWGILGFTDGNHGAFSMTAQHEHTRRIVAGSYIENPNQPQVGR